MGFLPTADAPAAQNPMRKVAFALRLLKCELRFAICPYVESVELPSGPAVACGQFATYAIPDQHVRQHLAVGTWEFILFLCQSAHSYGRIENFDAEVSIKRIVSVVRAEWIRISARSLHASTAAFVRQPFREFSHFRSSWDCSWR